MPKISIALIRSCHPGVDVDDLHLLDVIRLINHNITEIDNLEVFSNVKALFLNKNSIKKIENLEYLTALTFIDLSSNCIDSESLRSSLANIPRTLETLNLSSNPCCQDENCLQLLQDTFPNLNIIIGVEDGEDEEEEDDVAGENEESEAARTENREPNQEIVPLDDDAVLRELVERKCTLQQLGEARNMEDLFAVLLFCCLVDLMICLFSGSE